MKVQLLACVFVAATGCRSGSAGVTPLNQGESEHDIKISQEVRRGVIAQEDLSVSAKNVEVITSHGVVTLRGPVDSADEKSEVAQLARQVDGVRQVDNRLEIAAR